jgi:ribosomal protein S18
VNNVKTDDLKSAFCISFESKCSNWREQKMSRKVAQRNAFWLVVQFMSKLCCRQFTLSWKNSTDLWSIEIEIIKHIEMKMSEKRKEIRRNNDCEDYKEIRQLKSFLSNRNQRKRGYCTELKKECRDEIENWESTKRHVQNVNESWSREFEKKIL